jgi:hypothetical protein
MKIKLVLAFLSIMFLAACSNPFSHDITVTVTEVGKVTGSSALMGSFNESDKTQIETADYTFIVQHLHSVMIGSSMELVDYPDGTECLQVVGGNYKYNGSNPTCWLVYK